MSTGTRSQQLDFNALAWIDYYGRTSSVALTYGGPSELIRQLVLDACQGLQATDLVLEIGAGTGLRHEPLYSQMSCRILISDVAVGPLSISKSIKNERLFRAVMNAGGLALCRSVASCIIASDVFMHFREWRPYLDEAALSLKPAGILIFNWLGPDDCQRDRATLTSDGYSLPNGVPVTFIAEETALSRIEENGRFEVARIEHVWRHDPPHPEFHPDPHVHDEWAIVCRKRS